MKPISADSHVVEGPEVFSGLAKRFGDQAPRVMRVGDQADCMLSQREAPEVLMWRKWGWLQRACLGYLHLKGSQGHKPDVANMQDPELVELFTKGYSGMRPGLRDGACRYQDQDQDGIAAEFSIPGFSSCLIFLMWIC